MNKRANTSSAQRREPPWASWPWFVWVAVAVALLFVVLVLWSTSASAGSISKKSLSDCPADMRQGPVPSSTPSDGWMPGLRNPQSSRWSR